MSTYGENLRSKHAATPAEEAKEAKRFTGPPDQCARGGSHRWSKDAEQTEAQLKISEPEQHVRVRLGSCIRCGDAVLAISSYTDPRWAVHERLTSVRPAEQN